MSMVRSGYAPLLTARYVEFLQGAVIDGTVIVPLRLIDADNTVRVALYIMERQKDGAWRIAGCRIAPSTMLGHLARAAIAARAHMSSTQHRLETPGVACACRTADWWPRVAQASRQSRPDAPRSRDQRDRERRDTRRANRRPAPAGPPTRTCDADARAAMLRPRSVTTGRPAYSASLTVVCDPKGCVSRYTSASRKRAR